MKKVIVIVMLISILLLGLTGIVFSQENIIKIGASISLTGKTAYEGRKMREGYDLWEEKVNSNGGITAGGINYKVEMVYYDDESRVERSAKLTEMLITQNKVDFLFGPYSSAITFATTAIGEKYNIITIAPQANSTAIYERGYKYVFAVLPPAPMIMVPTVYAAADFDPKPKTAAIILENDLFPISCADGFVNACKEVGIEVVLYEKYPVGSTDISVPLTKARNLDPDILAIACNIEGIISFMKQSKELNLNPRMYAMSMGITTPVFLDELGADGEYVFEAEWWLPNMNSSDKIFGTTKDFVQACKDKYGPDYMPEQRTASGAAAGTLLQLAIEKADSIETEKVREALLTFDLELATSPAIKFNEKGQNVSWLHPVIQVQNGKFVTVYPESSKENAPIYPTPEWKNR